MEISLYGNACIELELKPCSTMGKRLFNVQRVRCDASKICFLSARNDLNGYRRIYCRAKIYELSSPM